MSFEYRLVVISGINGSSKGTITQSDPLFSLDSYDVAPDGNCLEATFRLPPKALSFTVEPRDVITIETRPDSTSSWVPRYRGYVTLAGNPRSDNVETYRLVGMKQRLYEAVLWSGGQAVIDSADVAVMANEVFNGCQIDLVAAYGINFATGRDIPTLGFNGGQRFTQLETAGSALDALAASVGRFIVPTSQTYSYDGETFNAGDLVPPTTWGVRPDGTVFFRRSLANAEGISESDLDVDVSYPALSSEEVVNAPTLVYFPGMDLSNVALFQIRSLTGQVLEIPAPFFQPMSYRVTANNSSSRVVQLPNPSEVLENAQSLFTIFTDTFTNSANLRDGNSATFATATNTQEYFLVDTPVDPVNTAAALFVDAEISDTISFVFGSSYLWSVGGDTLIYDVRYVPEAPTISGDTRRIKLVFPILIPASLYKNWVDNSYTLGVGHGIEAAPGPNGSGGTLKVYDFRVFQPFWNGNTTRANQLSQVYSIPVVQEVANIKLYKENVIRSQVNLTPLVGSVIDVPVERVQYSITTAEGVTTTYHAGQAFDGELVSERVVLEGLARRAVRS